ncbi:vitamin K epoxide reductase family protein [Sphingobacterium multivorum]|uniref:Vitamin K epoxide reductase family protein n=1 Tax=Sphingobacterium thalpophilum TaxID=259 RepID=A0ACD5BWP3_9SPHI
MPILNMLLNKSNKDNNLTFVCRSILRYYNARNTFSGVQKLVNAHLEYPSVLALIDTLVKYGIDSAVIRKAEYQYTDFKVPFVCAIQRPEWPAPYFTLVTEVNQASITYEDPIKKTRSVTAMEDFAKIDKDIVLLIEENNLLDEVDYELHVKKENKERIKRLLFLSFLMVVWSSFFFCNFFFFSFPINLIGSLFFLLATVGTCIGFLLISHDIDSHNSFVKEVCGRKRGKVNCDAVLNSKGNSFLGISWSVIGFTYFFSFLLSQLLFGLTNTLNLSVWSIVSLLAMPYVFYSIYYQWKIVKQWCPLCLAVQAVLFFLAILSLSYLTIFGLHFLSNIFQLLILCGIGVFIFGMTVSMIPVLKGFKEKEDYKKKWERLRFNPDIFNMLLQKKPANKFPTEGLGIQIGDPNARYEIIKICNPYCGPCKKSHSELNELIQLNPNVRARIIFTATGEDTDIKTLPVQHFLAIEAQYGPEVVKEALDKWYTEEINKYEDFAQQYPVYKGLTEQDQKIKAMAAWCDSMKIRVTPTFFINGYELPDSYRINELKNIL